MFDGIKRSAKETASRTARTAALGMGAFSCFGVGLAFLTVAAWIFLNTLMPAFQAALAIGLVYMGLGMILVAIIASQNGKVEQEEDQSDTSSSDSSVEPAVKMVLAFMSGIQAGRNARS